MKHRPQKFFDDDLAQQGLRRSFVTETVQMGDTLAYVNREIIVGDDEYQAAQDRTPWWKRVAKKTPTKKK